MEDQYAYQNQLAYPHQPKEHYHERLPNLHIVYYAYLVEPRWRTILVGQFQEIIESGIPASISFVLCGEPQLLEKAYAMIITMFQSYIYTIHTSTQNQYEYPGIKRLYELAQEVDESTLLIYFHSKGMVYYKGEDRVPNETYLTHNILQWKEYLAIFENPFIQKAGMFPSSAGFIWFNFFWVRSSYLKSHHPPRPSSIRYDFEGWLGKEDHALCWSYFSKSTSYFSPVEAEDTMKELVR